MKLRYTSPTQCYDDEDNDGDGSIDFPLDPGCSGVGDEDEEDRKIIAPQCFDQIDNDNDGAIDYPEDNGCFSTGDDSSGACGLTLNQAPYKMVSWHVCTFSRSRCSPQVHVEEEGVKRSPLVIGRRKLQAITITTDFPENEVESVIYVRHHLR